MDIFLYWPERMRVAVWADAAVRCIRATNRIPELMLADAILAANLTKRRIS